MLFLKNNYRLINFNFEKDKKGLWQEITFNSENKVKKLFNCGMGFFCLLTRTLAFHSFALHPLLPSKDLNGRGCVRAVATRYPCLRGEPTTHIYKMSFRR